MKLQTLKGMQDLLPHQTQRWQSALSILSRLAHAYGFEEIQTPILEPLELYQRGVGQNTDIVQKEMFAFTDQGGTDMCARPEGTASVMRSYIQHHMDQEKPLTKLYYHGPFFRHERPQKGRFRQFHQFGVETIGKRSPSLDVEMICLAMDIATVFKIPSVQLEINSLGDLDSRKGFEKVLQTHLAKAKDVMSEHERERLEQNPLRLLDSKNPKLSSLIQEAPRILDHLNDASKAFFDDVVSGLDAHKIAYTINPAIVRGMDYYCDTAFELLTDALGAQNTIIGGGRYDGLSSQLGSESIAASGFALGLERLLLVSELEAARAANNIVVLALEANLEEQALVLASQLRASSTSAHIHFLSNIKSMKSGLRAANKYSPEHVLILGPDEAKQKTIVWKNFQTQSQTTVAWDQLPQTMKDVL